jgi:hypothetical protein
MARHKWIAATKESSYGRSVQMCKNCDMLRRRTRDGVKADGRTPRYGWGYDTERGFVVPDRVPSCRPKKNNGE